MHFTLPKKPLVAALAIAADIAATKSSIQAVTHVLIEPLTNVARITATDLELGYLTAVENIVWYDSPDIIPPLLLPAKKLHECVKAIPVSDIAFTVNPETLRVTVSGGTVTYTLAGLDPAEFPELPKVEGQQFDIDAAALVRIIKSVAYAQSRDDKKYNLCGIWLKIEESEDDLFLTAAATDGHRLALDTVPLPGEPREIPKDLAKGIIVSSKGVGCLGRLTATGIICLCIAGNHLLVSTPEEKLYLRLVDGSYPEVDRVIPRHHSGTVEVKRLAFLDALERCRILSDAKSHATRIGFNEGAIALSSEILDCGNAADQVTADINCEPFDVCLNADYLIDALSHLDSGFVQIQVRDPLSPVMVTSLGTSEPLAVVMPQRG